MHQKCKDFFSAPELLPLGPVRTGLPVNLCTHLTLSSPKKCKTSHLKCLYCDYWACERSRLTGGEISVYISHRLMFTCRSLCFTPSSTSARRQRAAPKNPAHLWQLTILFYSFLNCSQCLAEGVRQAAVKASMLACDTQSRGFFDKTAMAKR